MWHIFGFRTHFRTPSVNLLFVHLPNEQPVVYDEADDLEERMRKANGAISDLMRFFSRPVFAEFSALTYLQYYEQYSVEQDQRHPSNRRKIRIYNDNGVQEEDQVVQSTHHRDRYQNYVYKKTKPNVSRLQYMSPDYGPVWYLRLLLLHRPAYTLTALRTSNRMLHPTYEACARDLGLIHNVSEYQICMEEAAQFSTSKELRRLFVTLILHGAPAPDLWNSSGRTCLWTFQSQCPPKPVNRRH